uniref:Uncharacterized protein n=1 Tax=Mycena chlorophos TaxID=658473 RepID=A0ABQ0L6F3_MYCCL|nr:predicted protein [Mycena chlorophos]
MDAAEVESTAQRVDDGRGDADDAEDVAQAHKDGDEAESGDTAERVEGADTSTDGDKNEKATASDVKRRITLPPPMPNIADLNLHSPSSAIVGTPFSDDLHTRFEYPFFSPETGSATAASSPEMSPTRTFHSISPSPSATALASTSQPVLPITSINAPPALQHFPASFPAPNEMPNYSPTHPKMRAVLPPPEPPSLTKRRQRWTLGLGSLKRKLSLRTGSSAPGSSSSQPASPPEDADTSHRRAVSEASTAPKEGL